MIQSLSQCADILSNILRLKAQILAKPTLFVTIYFNSGNTVAKKNVFCKTLKICFGHEKKTIDGSNKMS